MRHFELQYSDVIDTVQTRHCYHGLQGAREDRCLSYQLKSNCKYNVIHPEKILKKMTIFLFLSWMQFQLPWGPLLRWWGVVKRWWKSSKMLCLSRQWNCAVSLGDNVCRSNSVLYRRLRHSFKPHQRETGQFHCLLRHDIFEDFDPVFSTCCHFRNGYHSGSNSVKKRNLKNWSKVNWQDCFISPKESPTTA